MSKNTMFSVTYNRRMFSSEYLKITSDDDEEYKVKTTDNFLSFVISGNQTHVVVKSVCPSLLQTFRGEKFKCIVQSGDAKAIGTKINKCINFLMNGDPLCTINTREETVSRTIEGSIITSKLNFKHAWLTNYIDFESNDGLGIGLGLLAFSFIYITPE